MSKLLFQQRTAELCILMGLLWLGASFYNVSKTTQPNQCVANEVK